MKTEKLEECVFDTFALIAFFQKEVGGEKIKEALLKAKKRECRIYLNEINLGEVYYRIWKDQGEEIARQTLNLCGSLPIIFVPIDREFILKAAELKAKYKISYADAFCLETARRENCPVITGDPEFTRIPGIKITWLRARS